MVKPGAVRDGHVGDILRVVEAAGFRIIGIVSKRLTRQEAERFYDVHVGKDFFEGLVEFITSGISVGVMLEGPDAVRALRRIAGATDPAAAAAGTIRAMFGTSVRENAVHASDSPGRVEVEAAVYFGDCPRAREGVAEVPNHGRTRGNDGPQG